MGNPEAAKVAQPQPEKQLYVVTYVCSMGLHLFDQFAKVGSGELWPMSVPCVDPVHREQGVMAHSTRARLARTARGLG